MNVSSMFVTIFRFLYRINHKNIAQLGREIQILQGRGFGTSTVAEEAKQALSMLSHRKKICVFDIGANQGEYSQAVLKIFPKAKIFAFEPSSASFSFLSERFFNSANVQTIQLAFGARKESGLLWFDKPGSGMASLTKRRLEHFGINFEGCENVNIDTLDNWCRENQVFPDLLKLDVEGHELDVLKGAQNSIRKVQVIQFEFGGCNIDTRTYFQDFWYLFDSLGFALYRITPTGLTAIEVYSEEDEYFRTTNYIAINSNHDRD